MVEVNQIYNESCMETMDRMDSNSINLIITSPFYNTNRPILTKKRHNGPPEGRYDVHLDNMTSDEYVKFSLELFNKFDRILKKDAVVLYNICYGTENTEDMFLVISNLIEKSVFTVADVICWKKNSAIPNNVSPNKFTRIWEFVFVLCRKCEFGTFHMNKKITGKSKSGQNMYENIFNFIEAPNNDGSCDLNKATFSSMLVEKLLKYYAPDNAVVYDPFMGTGTTGIACKRLGYSYIGSEISTSQVEYANNRINGIKSFSSDDGKVFKSRNLFGGIKCWN